MPLFRTPSARVAFRTSTSGPDLEMLTGTIKTLFFRRYYKRCANRCLQYLKDYEKELLPAYKIFLYFFAGMSNDCYARGMPGRSPLIPSTLDEAEEFFTKAQTLLCEARIVTPHSYHPSREILIADHESDAGSSYRSLHRSRHSEDTTSRPSTAATSVSACSADTDILFYECDDTPNSKPAVSPLNVRKYEALPETPSKLQHVESTSLFSNPSNSPAAELTLSRPDPRMASFFLLKFPPAEPPPPPKTLPPPPRTVHFQSTGTKAREEVEDDTPWPDEDDCFHEPDHVEIYNSQLNSFAEMLDSHVVSLRAFRDHMQTQSHFPIARWRVKADSAIEGEKESKMSPEEKMQRILKGRERKWTRKRFDPTKYRELCELAIAEL